MVVAVVLHTTGHRFDPCRVYKKEVLSIWLARLTVNQVRKACRFDPYHFHTGQVAQLGEHRTVNTRVVGSYPTLSAISSRSLIGKATR